MTEIRPSYLACMWQLSGMLFRENKTCCKAVCSLGISAML